MSWRTRACAIAGGAACAFVVAAVFLSRPPEWWRPSGRADADAVSRGETLENALVTETHRVRDPGSAWSVKLRDADVNAWLATRLPKWLAHAGTDEAPRSAVRFVDGAIEIGVEVPGLASVGIARLEPTIVGGRLQLDRSRARLGTLPLPMSAEWFLTDAVEALRGPDVPAEAKLVGQLLGGESVEPRFRLSDGRGLVLQDLWLAEGELRLEFATVGPRGEGR